MILEIANSAYIPCEEIVGIFRQLPVSPKNRHPSLGEGKSIILDRRNQRIPCKFASGRLARRWRAFTSEIRRLGLAMLPPTPSPQLTTAPAALIHQIKPRKK